MPFSRRVGAVGRTPPSPSVLCVTAVLLAALAATVQPVCAENRGSCTAADEACAAIVSTPSWQGDACMECMQLTVPDAEGATPPCGAFYPGAAASCVARDRVLPATSTSAQWNCSLASGDGLTFDQAAATQVTGRSQCSHCGAFMARLLEGECLATGSNCDVLPHGIMLGVLVVLVGVMAWRCKQRAAKNKQIRRQVRKMNRKFKHFGVAVKGLRRKLAKRSTPIGRDPDAAPRHASSEEEDEDSDGSGVGSPRRRAAAGASTEMKAAMNSSFASSTAHIGGMDGTEETKGDDGGASADSDADLVVAETDGAGNALADDAVWRLLHKQLGSFVSDDGHGTSIVGGGSTRVRDGAASPMASSRSLAKFASVASVISIASGKTGLTSGIAIGGAGGKRVPSTEQEAGSSSRERQDRVPAGVRSVSFQLPGRGGDGESSNSSDDDNDDAESKRSSGVHGPLSPRRSPGSLRGLKSKQHASPRLATIPASPVPDADLPMPSATGFCGRYRVCCARCCTRLLCCSPSQRRCCRKQRTGVAPGGTPVDHAAMATAQRLPTRWFCSWCYRETCCNRRPAAVDGDLGVPREPMDALCCCTPRMSPYLRHKVNLCKRQGRLCGRRMQDGVDVCFEKTLLAGAWLVEWVKAPCTARDDEAGDWGNDTRQGPNPKFVSGIQPQHYTLAHIAMMRDCMQLAALITAGLTMPHALKTSVGIVASAIALDFPSLLPGKGWTAMLPLALCLVVQWTLWLLMYVDRSYLRWYHNAADRNMKENKDYTPHQWTRMHPAKRWLWGATVFALCSVHLPAMVSLLELMTCHPLVACDVCDTSPFFDLSAGPTTLAVVLVAHVMFATPVTLAWLITQSRPVLFTLTPEMKTPHYIKAWRRAAVNRFVDKLAKDRSPFVWLYSAATPRLGLWYFSGEVAVKSGLALLIAVGGPGHPVAMYAAVAALLALLAVFFQEATPLLEPSANFAATCVCAALLLTLTFSSLAAVAASALAPGVIAAIAYFVAICLLGYVALPWRYLHKRLFRLAELDTAKYFAKDFMTDEKLTEEVRKRVWHRFWLDTFNTQFYQHLGRRFEEVVDLAETMGHERFQRATTYMRRNWTLIRWVEENLEGANAYYKPTWANEAWDRHFTGFGRLWITRFPFTVHLTYDDPLPEDPAARRRKEQKKIEAGVREQEEASKRHLKSRKRKEKKAQRAKALAAVRAKARQAAGTPDILARGSTPRSGGESKQAAAEEGGKGSSPSKRRGKGRRTASARRRHRRARKRRSGQVDEDGVQLLNLATDSSQDVSMHAIDLRRLVRQNRSPEIQRRARIRDRLLALADRRIRLPKTLHVPIAIKVLQDKHGRVYRRSDLEFVETRWIYHEVHRVRFPTPSLFGQTGTMWKVEEFHFAKDATRVECRPKKGVFAVDILDVNGKVEGKAAVMRNASKLKAFYGVLSKPVRPVDGTSYTIWELPRVPRSTRDLPNIRTMDKFVKLSQGQYKAFPPAPPTIVVVGEQGVSSLDIKERSVSLKRPIEFEAATMVIHRDYRWRVQVPTPEGDREEVTKVGFRPVFEFRDGRGANTFGEEVTRVRHATDARVVGMSTTYAMTEDMIHLFRENRALTDKYVPRLRRERGLHRKLLAKRRRAQTRDLQELFLTCVYSASPIPSLEAVRKYFETHESGYTHRLLTAYKDEVAELYSRLNERLSTVVGRFWYVVFDELFHRNRDIPEVEDNFELMDVLEETAIAWTPMSRTRLTAKLQEVGLYDPSRPKALLGQFIDPLYAAMREHLGWIGSDEEAATRGADSGDDSGSQSDDTGTESSYTDSTHSSELSARGGSASNSSLSTLGSRTSAASLAQGRRRKRRAASRARMKRRARQHRRRRGLPVSESSASSSEGDVVPSGGDTSSTNNEDGEEGQPGEGMESKREPGGATVPAGVPFGRPGRAGAAAKPSPAAVAAANERLGGAGDTSAQPERARRPAPAAGSTPGRFSARWQDLARPRMGRASSERGSTAAWRQAGPASNRSGFGSASVAETAGRKHSKKRRRRKGRSGKKKTKKGGSMKRRVQGSSPGVSASVGPGRLLARRREAARTSSSARLAGAAGSVVSSASRRSPRRGSPGRAPAPVRATLARRGAQAV